jgi:F1F0 ATPase subunit 2
MVGVEMDAPANQTGSAMTTHFPLITQIATGLCVGFLAGSIHFASLHWNVRLIVAGSPGWAFALQLLRMAGVAVLFFALAKLGTWALLCGAAGLLLARFAILLRIQRVRVAP